MKEKAKMNENKNKRTSRIRIGAVILVMLAYTLICYVIIDKYSGVSKEVSGESGSDNNMVSITLDHLTMLPLPDSDASVEWECGTYYSDISKADMEMYLARLSAVGWKDLQGKDIDTEIVSGSRVYDLMNGNHMLQLMTFLEDSDYSFYNSILVYYDKNTSYGNMRYREEAAQKEDVLPLIQTKVNELSKKGVISDTRDVITGLFEIDIKGAYERLQLQAFAAYSDLGYTGCFLIRKGSVTYVTGNLSNAYVVDIDMDGSFEILDAYDSWEANTFRLELVAYEYVSSDTSDTQNEILKQKYYTCYVPVDGYDAFKLNMDKAETITLIGETRDYGKIAVRDELLVIVGDRASDFISWTKAFDQSKLSGIKKDVPDAPPQIRIELEGTKLDYIVHKNKWSDKEEVTEVNELTKAIEVEKKEIITVSLGTAVVNESASRILIDFGNSIPDRIAIYDAMLEENGSARYNLNAEQGVQIIDDKTVSFPLTQHFAYYLSSNSKDYEKDWRRLFQVVCTWGEKECTYAFIINTEGKALGE